MDSKELNDIVVPLLESMRDALGKRYGDIAPGNRQNYKYYDELSMDFNETVQGDKCRKFFELRGTMGSYLSIPPDVHEPGAFNDLVAAVRKALRPS